MHLLQLPLPSQQTEKTTLNSRKILGLVNKLQDMYQQVPLQPGQSFKFTVLETLDRIKEEFQFLQAQYHSLKLECEKLASEKTEMQRHYIMYYEMSYGLNIEMHKQVKTKYIYATVFV
uniref:Groucho/TLE N-terminal Q-rich domain-containing protein n=1 Tax=Periophthalmus magnuspinnatus TaxID=409849 RepID=A0A3B4ASV0_9GOBI